MTPALIATGLDRLNSSFLEDHPELLDVSGYRSLPERVLQFGEGGFLRGFVDWMIHGMNRQGLFCGRVVVVQPIADGQVAKLNQQDGAYTLLMRGLEGGKVIERQELITSIRRGINPYTQFSDYLQCAHNPDLRFIVSNTTEAGIVYNAEDKVTDAPPVSFPAKLTRLLLERYRAFAGDREKGFVILPCELIERNGDRLREAVLQTAANWNLEPAFREWVTQANIFTNTLVDRIVTGFPKEDIDTLTDAAGYRDDLFDTSEVFHLWVIEGPASIAAELPLKAAGFNVVVTDNMKPYRDRKVGILNGAHTSMALASYLAGFDFVGQCIEDPLVAKFLKQAVYEEIIPTLTLPQDELAEFAASVFERFGNPFIRHSLHSISLNSVSKYKARVLPTVERYYALHGSLPQCLAFGLAALIAFYRGTRIKEGALIAQRGGFEYRVKDNLPILEKFADLWSRFDESQAGTRSLVEGVLQQAEWWGQNLCELPGLTDSVSESLYGILTQGVTATMARTLDI